MSVHYRGQYLCLLRVFSHLSEDYFALDLHFSFLPPLSLPLALSLSLSLSLSLPRWLDRGVDCRPERLRVRLAGNILNATRTEQTVTKRDLNPSAISQAVNRY